MSPNTPSSPVPPSILSGPPPAVKKTRWLLYGCVTFFALLLLIVATVVITLWWVQRPIKPVVLSASEKTVIEEKLHHLGGGNPPAPTIAPARNRGAEAVELPHVLVVPAPEPNQKQNRPYVTGSNVLKLTEREINGLLNANTDLGKSVRLEFAQDAVNAYVAVRIPEDFPIGGGKMFRARSRFRVSLGNDKAPYAILEDVTIFGLSLPKAWLAGLKGENLIGQAIGEPNGSAVLRGIKSLRVEPGALVLEVED
ncbi:MAG: hypothetical protein ABI651_11550 [Verrucomicrobiota bacterium]